MITTRWLQGKDNINEALRIRNAISDIFDDFAFYVVVYEDLSPAGTGRLLFKDGKYFIDNVCVLNAFKDKQIEDLIIRMLVRRAVNMGAQNTYAEIIEKNKLLYENIGFEIVEYYDNMLLMKKYGDVGGHCS